MFGHRQLLTKAWISLLLIRQLSHIGKAIFDETQRIFDNFSFQNPRKNSSGWVLAVFVSSLFPENVNYVAVL